MRGIVIDDGKGASLYPMTKFVSKQLMPIYDKPSMHYPLSDLFLSIASSMAKVN